MRYFFLFFAVFLFGFHVNNAKADVFELHFFYNPTTKEIHLDKKVPEPISLNKEKNLAIIDFDQMFSNPGPFEFLFFDSSGDRIEEKQFSPQDGAFTIDVPYYSAVTSFVLRKTGSQENIDSFDVSHFSKCNRNGICEFEKGETISTCLTDCTSGNFSPETQKLLKQNNNLIKDPKSGDILLRGIQLVPVTPTGGATTGSSGTNTIVFVISAVVLALVGLGVWILIKLWRKNKQYGL